MFKRNFYTCLLVAAGILFASYSYGQDQDPTSDYSTLTGGVNTVGGDYYPATKVCPSTSSCSSTDTFQVSVNFQDYSDIQNASFEWVVYGGYITAINGNSVSGTHEVYSGVRFSQARATGIANSSEAPQDWVATAIVEWDTLNFSSVNGWVAVRQTSEWGCSDLKWSVFRNLVHNNPPTFTTFPISNIHLPFDYSDYYNLPVPEIAPNDCNVLPSCTTTMTVTVEDQTGDVYFTGSNTDNVVPLLRPGTNIITWTLFDGSRTTRQSYNLIVEPAFEILHAAWLNPWGGNNNGSILVTGITPGLTGTKEYSFDEGTWVTATSATGLATGAHTIDARITYDVDIDSDGDFEDFGIVQNAVSQYSYTLHAMSGTAVDSVPAEGTYAKVKDVSCLSSTDGKIDVEESFMNVMNNSVDFSGDDFILLNKRYEGSLSSFSVSAWIKVPSGSTAEGTILSFDNNEFYQLSLSHWTSSGVSRVRFQTTSSGGLDNEMFFHTKQVNDGNWHFIVATYNAGQHVLYVDGERQAQSNTYGNSVGSSTDPRYGMIGARSATPDFIADPQVNYFVGQIAEVAIWDGTVLLQADVTSAMKSGITSFISDRWVLNDVPTNISTQSSVFTDIGNSITLSSSHWGRFYNGTLSEGNSPKLYSYTDSKGGGIGIYPPTADQINLGEGTYTLHVRDVYGGGVKTGDYKVENSDALPPEIYWSASAGKTARQSVTDTYSASLAIDGFRANYSQTSSHTEAWWEVDLGGIFPIRAVDIHPRENFSNFYVIASQTPFADYGVSTLLEDLAVSGAVSVQYAGTTAGSTSIPISANARYVRIRAVGNLSLRLNEVEVFTNLAITPVRTLYLGEECHDSIVVGEYSIDPKVFDSCNGITSFKNDKSNDGTLVKQVFELGDNLVTWTATDDIPETTTLQINYRVVDNTNPVMSPLPFGNSNDTITFCKSKEYVLPIPKISDNYLLKCGPLYSIELYSYINGNPFRAFDFDPAIYNPSLDQLTDTIYNVDYLPEGDIILEWRVKDHNWSNLTPNKNIASDSLKLHIEREPRVVEVKVSPRTCYNSDNAQVIFSRIRSEKDINPATDIIYILRDTVSPYNQISNAPNDSIFEGVDPGIYQAYIEVNGCRSNPYPGLIRIANPDTLEATAIETQVMCSGMANGGLELTVEGGSRTDILHFFGNEENSALSTYSALNLGETGTIEGWIYLDSLISGGVNDNAGLFGVNNATDGYGFRMVNSNLTFYVGSLSVSAGTINERQWYHISGTWSSTTGNITLSVYGGATVTAAGIPAGFTVPTGGGGTLYLGDVRKGDGVLNNLHGFVRNVRIWDRVLTSAEIANNLYMLDPIDLGFDLVANFPVAAGGGTTLQNRSQIFGAVTGIVEATNYAWQKFAYTWTNSSGTRVSNRKDLVKVVADNYTVAIQDPLGCFGSKTFGITIKDKERPILIFSDNGYNGSPVLTAGQAIQRNTDDTNADIRNVSGDCLYYPSAMEFNPYVDDGDCPAGDVVLSFTILNGEFADPLYVPDNDTLDGAPMTDEMTLTWTATDMAGNDRTVDVTYRIIDNELPVLTWGNRIKQTDEDDCGYTVKATDLDMKPTVTENCSTGRLYNNLNGLDSLVGYRFEGGTTTNVIWTYEDKSFGAGLGGGKDTVQRTVTILDDQVPEANCRTTSLVAGLKNGKYTLNAIDIDDSDDPSNDNCGTLTALNVTRNIAYNQASVSQSTYQNGTCFTSDAMNAGVAVDGITSALASCSSTLTTSQANPYWQVDLGEVHTIYGLRIFSDDVVAPLNNFWVAVSTDGVFCSTCDMPDPSWDGNVNYTDYYSGADVSGSVTFSFTEAISGRYVRIWMNNPSGGVLSLAEVEVYGTTTPSAASSITLDCNDVRYTPAPDTGTPGVWDDVKGTFRNNGFMLTAIDDEGNVASCIANVNVQDNVQPIAIPIDIDVYLDDNGVIILNDYINEIDNGSSDSCGIAALWVTPTDALSCLNIGNYDATLYARDIYGNIGSEVVTVNITDNAPPSYTLRTNIQLPLNADGVHTLVWSDIFSDVDDNCTDDDDLIFSFNPDTVKCLDLGPIDLTVTITDKSNQKVPISFDNLDTDPSRRVQVVDNIPPVASLSNFVLIIPEDGDSMIRFQDIIAPTKLYDNCDKYTIPTKEIRYSSNGEWCTNGLEGTFSAGAFTNLATEGYNTESASEVNYSTYVVTNASDENPNTVFISGGYAGERYLEYNFGTNYQFNSTQVRWHEDNTLVTVTPISQTLKASINVSYDATAGHTNLAGLNDGNSGCSGTYNGETDCGNGPNYRSEQLYYQYDFGSKVTMNSTCVRWNKAPSRNYYYPRIDTSSNGTSWATAATFNSVAEGTWISLSFGSISARYVRLVFDRPGNDDVRCSEWVINQNTGYNCILPTSGSTRFQYYDGSWHDVPGCATLGVAATPDDNTCNFSSNITASRFRLYYNTSINGRVGIKEWRVFGREVPTGANIACTKYDCGDVHKDVDVWLQWADNSKNYDSVHVTVPVEPYFDITTIDIKDCGYDGERYYPTILGKSTIQTYTYIWDEIDDEDYLGNHYALFQEYDCNKVSDTELPYTMPIADQEWIGLITTDCTPYPADGDYMIKLYVEDDNECWDNKYYSFSYIRDNTTATSIDSVEACVGEEETYGVLFAENWSFWRRSSNRFWWPDLAALVSAGDITIVSGGKSYGDAGTTYGDSKVTLTFNRSTSSLGHTTDFLYRYQARKFTQTVTSTRVQTVGTTAWNTGNQYTLIVLDSLKAGGPYFTEDNAARNRTLNPGTKYVLTNGNDWFGDYTNCMESREYRATVYQVATPVIYAYDAYSATPSWIPANTLSVCPRDTIWYKVNNIGTGDYAYFDWSIMSDDATPVATGRRLAQGNSYDDSIQIVWDQFPVEPQLTVKGYNALDCSSTAAEITHDFTDNVPPILDCSSRFIVEDNFSGKCEFTFTNLPPPVMTDNCRNRIASYSNDFNLGTNAAGTYDVGTTTVTWTATDFSGNSGTCFHTVIVNDSEAPTIKNILDTTVYASNSCAHLFTGNKRDAIFTENCDASTVTLSADIFDDRTTNGVFNYPIATNLGGLNNFTFVSDTSYVVWKANDGRGNESTKDFFVVVDDTTRPTISDIINLLAVPNDIGYCWADTTITPPAGDQIWDNCTPDGSLLVEFTGRDDGEDEIGDPYPVGTTTISWRVSDTAIPPNRKTAKQTVTVIDNQPPWFDNDLPGIDPALQDTVSIGYCKRGSHKIRIPRPYDNCRVDRIDWSIVNDGGAFYSESGFITRLLSANFDPFGDGLTSEIATLPADPITGSNYIVTWTVTDAATPTPNKSTETYSYILHVEKEPYFLTATPTALTCGNSNDGQITVVTAENYRVEPGYNIDYTIRNWEKFQTDTLNYVEIKSPNIFTDLSGGDYDVQMRVNGCYSEKRKVTIVQPAVYEMELDPIPPYCYEDTTGMIDLTLRGGAPGQIHFANPGAGVSALDYDSLNLTTKGSIEAWVYLESLDDAVLVSKGNSYSLSLLGGKFTINVGGAWWGTTTTGAGISPVLRRWYYVVGNWNSGSMNLYVDGYIQTDGCSVQGSFTSAPLNTSSLTIGADFAGIIRDVSIWNIVTSGGKPSKKYTSELGIAANWTMDNGSGPTAPNSCKSKNPNAKDLTGVTWDNDEPQPGKYTWTKDGANYSNDIDLTDLGRGVYKATFQDPFGCPEAPGLQQTATLTPTDAQKPEISVMANITLYVDPGPACQRIITTSEIDTLIPEITDSCAIESVTWEVTPVDNNPNTQYFPNFTKPTAENFAGAILELGRNKVDVWAYQYNGKVSESAGYSIFVKDSIPPVADGLNVISGNLSKESGIVFFDAFGFNEGSEDNCSDLKDLQFRLWNGTDWVEEISYGCAAVGTDTIPVRFRVRDEAGNTAEDKEIKVKILDIFPPAFTAEGLPISYQTCATTNREDGDPDDFVIIEPGKLLLDPDSYLDNCGVVNDSIKFWTDHEVYTEGDNPWEYGKDAGSQGYKFYVGKTSVWFQIEDPSGGETPGMIYDVEVLPKPFPASIE